MQTGLDFRDENVRRVREVCHLRKAVEPAAARLGTKVNGQVRWLADTRYSVTFCYTAMTTGAFLLVRMYKTCRPVAVHLRDAMIYDVTVGTSF